MYSRIAALPDAAEPLQRAQIMTALSVGIEIINLRRIAPQLGLDAELDAALAALAQGHSAAATARFAALDRRLAALAESGSQAFLALRTRAMMLLVADALVQHGAYFDAGEARLTFHEIDLFGVYVAPISLLMVAAWFVTIGLRRIADRFGLLRHVWHPSLFVFAVYIIVLSSIVLVIAR